MDIKTIVATDTVTVESGKVTVKTVVLSEAYDVANLFTSDRWYTFGVGSGTAKIVTGTGSDNTTGAILPYFGLNFYKSNGDYLRTIYPNTYNTYSYISGSDLKDAATMKIFANIDNSHNLANLLDEAIYKFTITGKDKLNEDDGVYESNLLTKQNISFSLKKVIPTTVNLPVFRPKQETEDGSKKFIAYMVPDSLGTMAATNYPFSYVNNTNGSTAFGYALGWGNDATKKYFGTYTAKGISGGANKPNNPYGRYYGFKDLNNVFYNLNADSLYKFTFAQSFTDSVKTTGSDMKNNLPFVSRWKTGNDFKSAYGNAYGVQWLNPYIADADSTGYMLAVQKNYIDGTTEHAIDVTKLYLGVSTTAKANNSGYNFKQDAEATAASAFKVVYSTWIKASTFTSNGLPDLQWTAAGQKVDTLDLSKIKATNSYNADLFGPDVNSLFAKNFLYPTGVVQFSTDANPSATSQINPYFQPFAAEESATASATSAAYTRLGGEGSPFINVTSGSHKGHVCVLVSQKSVQADAAPVADHEEYLVLKVNDAFGFVENVSAKVNIKKPTTNARKH